MTENSSRIKEEEALWNQTAEAEPGFNILLIRERANHIVSELKEEFARAETLKEVGVGLSKQRARLREAVNSDPAPLRIYEKGLVLTIAFDHLFGFGPLGPLIRAYPNTLDAISATPNVVMARCSSEWRQTLVMFDDPEHIRTIINRMLMPTGKQLGDQTPRAESIFPNGGLINANNDGPELLIDWSKVSNKV